ncbi:MAG: site-2 protease family protein, partial [Clostridia bacterium]|nr:site-2 protease family protein [Clostridia bacterium]
MGRYPRLTPLAAAALLGMIVIDRSGICAITALAALLHEAGHLTAAAFLHVPIASLRPDALGARLEVKGRMLSYGEEWILCAFGPLFSLLGAAAGALLWASSVRARIFSCASLLLGLLNLLPIFSFDGGRMLACALSFVARPQVAERILRAVSFVFLILL